MTITITPALHDALKTCSDIEREIIALGRRADPARKLDLVQCRRRFAENIGTLAQLIDAEHELKKSPDKLQEMGRLFSSFRYAIGQHQASWPAVRIDEDLIAYSASAHATYAKSGLFWHWCTQNLGFNRT
ncbi:MAG: hypothetical protein J7494_01595 [Sphingobium sp.]|nr:hypothetical protein [Sphingobium sp.]